MSNLPMYEMLARAFASEGVDTVFNLMGDGNMHWATAMSKIDEGGASTRSDSRRGPLTRRARARRPLSAGGAR